MVEGKPFEVSKEVYERAQANRGYMTGEDKIELFSEWERCGYGIYGAMVCASSDGKYYCYYSRGETCD